VIRVLIVADARPNRLVEPQWSLLARWLPREPFELHLCELGAPRTAATPDAGNFATASYIPWRGSLDAIALWRLRQLIQRLRPDVVHCWTSRSHGALSLIVRQSGARLIHSVGVSGAASGSSETVAPCVELPHVGPIDHAPFRRELGIPPDAHVLLTAGETLPGERTRDVIWACDLLKCVRNDYRLIVLADGPFRRRLERFVDQCQLNDLVRFAGPGLSLSTAVQHSQVFLTASLQPANELLLAAMAAECAVIATDLPQHRALITPAVTGILAQPRDRAGLARLIQKLLDNPELRGSVGKAARASVAERYSPSRLAAEFATVYQRAGDRGRHG